MTEEKLLELVNNVKDTFVDELPKGLIKRGQLLTLGYAVVTVVATGLEVSPNEVCELMATVFDAEKDENGNYKIQIPREVLED